MSQKRWYCGVHNEKITNHRLTHGNNRIPQGLRFYAEQTRKLLIPNTLKNKRNVKEVHPQRLGVNCTVAIRKYNRSIGQLNPEIQI